MGNQRNVVITGATSGIGFAAAKALASAGFQILGIGRDIRRCAVAENEIRESTPGSIVRFFVADLSSQKQIRTLVSDLDLYLDDMDSPSLDILINNAGCVANWFTSTEDGYELQFAVNHLAPFLLSNLLLPRLRRSDRGRILTVSSASHRNTSMHWKDVMYRRGYNPLLAYKQSKLANVLFSVEFNRRESKKSSVLACAIDPGLVNTGIGLKGTSGIVRWIWDLRRKGGTSPEKAAGTIVHLASVDQAALSGNVYWKDSRPYAPDKYSLKQDEAARLWDLSAQLCGL